MFVDCVDKHPTIRTLTSAQDWLARFGHVKLRKNINSQHRGNGESPYSVRNETDGSNRNFVISKLGFAEFAF
jgi:hypothetical protein